MLETNPIQELFQMVIVIRKTQPNTSSSQVLMVKVILHQAIIVQTLVNGTRFLLELVDCVTEASIARPVFRTSVLQENIAIKFSLAHRAETVTLDTIVPVLVLILEP